MHWTFVRGEPRRFEISSRLNEYTAQEKTSRATESPCNGSLGKVAQKNSLRLV